MSIGPTNILLTGHLGYIGSAVYYALHNDPFIDNVIGYDIIEGNDIMDYEKLVKVMTRQSITCVVHLAAMSTVTDCNNDPRGASRINCKGTNNVLKAMEASGCRHIIYASTSSVYGSNPSIPHKERHKTFPCSSYGLSKLWGEFAIQNLYDHKNYDGKYIIFRMFNVVGTAGVKHIDKRKFPASDRLFSALESGAITVYGYDYFTKDGTCERDYVALKDVVMAYRLAIEEIFIGDTQPGIINIGSGKVTSVKEIIDEWNSLNDLSKVIVTYGDRRQGDPEKVVANIKKAKRVLSWVPERKIEAIIREIVIDRQ